MFVIYSLDGNCGIIIKFMMIIKFFCKNPRVMVRVVMLLMFVADELLTDNNGNDGNVDDDDSIETDCGNNILLITYCFIYYGIPGKLSANPKFWTCIKKSH